MTTAAAREPIEADVMREYDENIRLYTPILQRIIILVAVIIAVPVVLWTITAFLRAYVAPPQLPTFRPIAAADNQAPVQVAAPTPNTATDTRTPLIEIKKPSASDAPQVTPVMPASTQPQQTAAATPPASASAAPAPATTVAAVTAPVTVPPPPFAATRSTPSTVAAPAMAAPAPAAPANVALANSAPVPMAPSSNAAMPAPPSSDNQPADPAASQEQSAANDNSANDLPAGTPLTGKIPLPTRRPHITGLTNVAANVTTAEGAAPMLSRVPLPRARPVSAPEPVSETPHPAYDPSQIH